MTNITSRSVAVTGGLGNLGDKLLRHLAGRGGYGRLIGLDVRQPDPARLGALRQVAQTNPAGPPTIDLIQCDLTDWHDHRWRDVIAGVDAVVHFAAQNPYPEAGWGDSAASLDMTLHVAHAAADSQQCRRFVFATSNHVMGRYKDSPLADEVGPGQLHPELEAGVGTVWHTGETEMDSTPYAVAKFAGERLCQALAARASGQITFVCVRIGWCQPGQNRPETISASGSPTLPSSAGHLDPETLNRTEQWFKGMWLSNPDFVQLFERAIEADAANWPGPCIIVNGMSNNAGMKWSLEESRRWLGYKPQADIYQVS